MLNYLSNRSAIGKPASVAVLMSVAGIAQAGPIYNYSVETPIPGHGNLNGGEVHSVDATFDTNTNVFSWEYTVDDDSDGFWLVVSPGKNPKGDPGASTGEHAILYGDTDNNLVTAYVYNGLNNSNSLNSPNVFLDQFALTSIDADTNDGRKSVSFSFDATDINNDGLTGGTNPNWGGPDWTGVAFGPQIGVWFHPSSATAVTYADNTNGVPSGAITSFVTASATTGWLDNSYQTTTQVPEPGILYLSALGLAAFGASRRVTRRS